jgi:2-C-methyl-D-erythritol 2,4-cyclodiphosphate synthase
LKIKVGFGFDVHQLVEGRELWIGGVKISHSKGALGHSDADVLLHAICDAILGASGLQDIGYHFPDTSEEYKGIDSKLLLKSTIKLMQEKGFSIGNIDATLCLEQPKIAAYKEEMQTIIAFICNISKEEVTIKATTNEKIGFIGRQDGLAAYAVVLLERIVSI